MKNGRRYTVSFLTVENILVTCSIYDTTVQIDDSDEVTTIALTGAAQPLRLLTIDNDENPFSPIRALQLEINFLSTPGLDVNLFLNGEDDRFYVEVEYGALIVFKGFLLLSDLSQHYQPPPSEIRLRATDGLGTLRDIDLEMFEREDDPLTIREGTLYYTWIEYVSTILKKTGLSLPINVAFNLMETSMSDLAHFIGEGIFAETFAGNNYINITGSLDKQALFTTGVQFRIIGLPGNEGVFTVDHTVTTGPGFSIYVDEVINAASVERCVFVFETDIDFTPVQKIVLNQRTFETTEFNRFENCYTVLEKILSQGCFLTQYLGEWWIVRSREMERGGLKVAEFTADGTLQIINDFTVFEKLIGKDQGSYDIERDTSVRFERPHKYVRLDYDFSYPRELVINQDFSQGGQILVESPPPPDGTRHYHADGWTEYDFLKSPTAASFVNYIERKFDENDYEKERYLVMGRPADNEQLSYNESTEIPVNEKDKITVSVDFRFENDWGDTGHTENILHVRFVAENGDIYLVTEGEVIYGAFGTIRRISGEWIKFYDDATDTVVGVQERITTNWVPDDVDEREWRTVSIDCHPVPGNGWLFIGLYVPTGGDGGKKHFQNLDLDYTPFINGNYREYEGVYYKLLQNGDYRAKIEETLPVSDSPNKLFKGALCREDIEEIEVPIPPVTINYITYPLAQSWQDRSMTQFQDISALADQPYSWFQCWQLWHYRRTVHNYFDARLRGCYGSNFFGLVHRYQFTQDSKFARNKWFMLLHFSLDMKACIWNGYFTEIYDTELGVSYDSEILEYRYKSTK